MGNRAPRNRPPPGGTDPHAQHIIFCTHFWRPCGLSFAPHRHLQGKARTVTSGSHKNRLRVCPARLRRKTHCYTKKLANLAASIRFCLLKKSQSMPDEQCPKYGDDHEQFNVGGLHYF